MEYPSWGLIPKVADEIVVDYENWDIKQDNVLPRGLGRSYGDSCLNDGGALILNRGLNRFISFDTTSGLLRCESGVTLDEILRVFVPKGWFLPVTPGTKFVTLGGAIANDVHGKNHHKAGNFCHFVDAFAIRRSDGEVLLCSKTENSDLFYSTIGGLGLTGFILWADLKLKKIRSSFISVQEIQFTSVDEFMELSSDSEEDYEYTVAWVDCVNGRDLKGIFMRGNHSSDGDLRPHKECKLTVPFYFPSFVLNRQTIGLFNSLYFHKNMSSVKSKVLHYDTFFYPLDFVHSWNKIYGQGGFYQYQFVIPSTDRGRKSLREILFKIKGSGMGSFLAVMKVFGSISSLGRLSFPKEGITLSLDFRNYGSSLLALLDDCDKVVEACGGRIYAAKDARMKSEFFKISYPLDEFIACKDHKFASNFSRRIGI